jgi:hypothetical protein
MISGSRFPTASSTVRTLAQAPKGASSARLPDAVAASTFSDRAWLRVALTLFFAAFSLLREGVVTGEAAAHPGLLRAATNAPLSGDLLASLALFHASPLWFLTARCAEFADISRVLVVLHIVARLASALAILRLGERVAGSRVAGVLAVFLWCGCSAASLGSAAPHGAFFTPGDVALPCALWAILLWSRARPEWGLLCGLAMCADAPLGLVLFVVLLGLIWWTPSPTGSVAIAGWRGAAGEARHRTARCSAAVCWWLLAVVPLAAFLAPPLRLATALVAGSAAPGLWHATVANFAAFLRFNDTLAASSPLSLSFVPALLLGLWCWRRAARSLPAARAVFGLAMFISVLSLGAALVREYSLPFAVSNSAYLCLVLTRFAPLALSLSLVGVAHSLERLAARQGARGLTLSFCVVLAFSVLPGPSWLWLACGLSFAALMQRSARRVAWKTSPQELGKFWARARAVFAAASRRGGGSVATTRWQNAAWTQRAARLALLLLLLASALQARSAALSRLQQNGRVLAILPDAAWLDAQRFARRKTPKRALFLAQDDGFRAFSRRAVFIERADKNIRAPFADFARRRDARLALAAPLWNDAMPDASWLHALKKRGVTHLTVNREARWSRVLALQMLYQNARFTIYKLR